MLEIKPNADVASRQRVYLDHAATSFPKAPGVLDAMVRYANALGASPGRGAYAEARASGELLWECRERIHRLIRGGRDATRDDGPERVVFTLNCSDALNLAIRGVVGRAVRATRAPAHVVTTAMDHNSVLRPLNELAERGEVEHTVVPADPETGIVDADAVLRAVRGDTALVAVVHASNVSGSVQPVERIGPRLRERGIPFLVDAAQTVGHLPIDVDAMDVSLLAFPGHKGLLGPLGTGGLYIAPGMERLVETVREGGTGSRSESDMQPTELPDRYEPGSHNAIGLIGLSEGVRWLLERGVERVAAHERELTRAFLDDFERAQAASGGALRLLGPRTTEGRVGVFSVVLEGVQPAALAKRLEDEFGLLTRAGLHCAPRVHETFGTRTHARGDSFAGATRLSVGAFTTMEDVRRATEALRVCAEGLVGVASGS